MAGRGSYDSTMNGSVQLDRLVRKCSQSFF